MAFLLCSKQGCLWLYCLLFFDAGGFAGLAPQVEQPGPANDALANPVDLLDARRSDGENSFHAHAVGHLAHGKGFAGTVGIAALDDGTLELLDTLFVAFADFYVYVNRITGFEVGEAAAPLAGFRFNHFNELAHDGIVSMLDAPLTFLENECKYRNNCE